MGGGGVNTAKERATCLGSSHKRTQETAKRTLVETLIALMLSIQKFEVV
jgi:hypothetical protein